MEKFVVVHFKDGLQVVPHVWMEDNGSCAWPNYVSHTRILKAICSCQEPEADWCIHEVKKVYGAAETYELAVQKLELCSQLLDIDSANDSKKNLKRKRARVEITRLDESKTDVKTEVSLSLPKEFPALPISTQTNIHSQESVIPKEGHLSDSSVRGAGDSNLSWNDSAEVCGDSAEFHKIVVKKLNYIISKLQDMEERFSNLENTITTHLEKPCTDFIENLGLPLDSPEAVDRMEVLLKDSSFFGALVNFLQGIGGRTLVSSINEVLARLLTNETAAQYSWCGFKGKRPFKDLRLVRVILNAVRSHYVNVTETTVGEHIQEWLRYGKLRSQRKKESKYADRWT